MPSYLAAIRSRNELLHHLAIDPLEIVTMIPWPGTLIVGPLQAYAAAPKSACLGEGDLEVGFLRNLNSDFCFSQLQIWLFQNSESFIYGEL